jgi:hypothetical protein
MKEDDTVENRMEHNEWVTAVVVVTMFLVMVAVPTCGLMITRHFKI